MPSTMTPAAFAALLGNLQLANPIALLLAAEAGAYRAGLGYAQVSPDILVKGALVAVATSVGYNPLGYNGADAQNICSVVWSFMQGLRFLCQGPSLAVPNGNFYTFNL
jgi:hypothetical protein